MRIEAIVQDVSNRFQQANLYYGHGTDNPDDEAFALVCMALDLPFDEAILDRDLSEQEEQKITALVDKRIQTRKPLSYLTNTAYFVGLPFYVDERVLIPRSPFGELIANQFQPWIQQESVKSILDIGTGSGCMAIAVALMFPDAIVDAVDLSKDALAVAKINCKKFEVEGRVNLILSDVFEQVPQKKYDIIISNPPYVNRGGAKEFPKEYQHEPAMALETKKHALDIVKTILHDASGYLADDGILVVEVGENRELLEKECSDISFIWLDFAFGGTGDVFLLTRVPDKLCKD